VNETGEFAVIAFGVTTAVVNAPVTASEKVFVAVALGSEAESVIVTVYVAATEVTDGVPVIAPVAAAIVNPVGSAGETA
jgi:hypothetical protein